MMQKAVLLSLLVALSLPCAARAAEFQMVRSDDGVEVQLDGQLFTRYVVKSGAKPILWPVIGPTGSPVTRGYPMDERLGPAEKADHVHHRSLWFTHGDVNGHSFWHESGNNANIVHREFVKVEGGKRGIIVTRNDWLDPAGKKQCEDRRTLTFHTLGKSRCIDFDVVLTAADAPVKFGDTKEGTFGVRVAGTMKVEAEQGGRIINSEGQTNRDAWGKAAAWVDYHGPVKGKTVGIAILNHPSSFRFPTYWHVRTYGLFAANPFGLHHFKGSNSVDGSHELKPGESFALRYRVIVHEGDEKQAGVAEAFSQYSQEAR